ncbi:MAG TPA: hypothetical protein VH417_07760 [Vicinamibacterales bacterium]|jgi:hypothetical protein
MRRFAGLGATLALAACTLACDESLSKIAGPTPNLEPTFASVQKEIFETTDAAGRQSCVSCHNANGQRFTAGLSLEHAVAYDQLVNVSSTERPGVMRVTPGNPDASYIVHKVEGQSGIVGRRMPYNGPPYLTDGQIQILRRWIAIGAPRN